ncbi:MAG: hydrogenase maturation nickel metallochaperone HypA [Thiotrichales bacterium]|nr:MAG: hydrogenase maturation nickel metallochaperone HypA [Thiotrichales bacterium]
MHELAICQALMNQVEGIAAERNARSVISIVVGMGPLSGVEAQLLKHAYPVASAGTVAEGAELVIENLPVRIKCSQCGEESEVRPNKLVCKTCGDWRTTVISGDELLLMSVELEKASTNQTGGNGSATTLH